MTAFVSGGGDRPISPRPRQRLDGRSTGQWLPGLLGSPVPLALLQLTFGRLRLEWLGITEKSEHFKATSETNIATGVKFGLLGFLTVLQAEGLEELFPFGLRQRVEVKGLAFLSFALRRRFAS